MRGAENVRDFEGTDMEFLRLADITNELGVRRPNPTALLSQDPQEYLLHELGQTPGAKSGVAPQPP